MFKIKLIVTVLTLVLFSCGKENFENYEVTKGVQESQVESTDKTVSGPFCNQYGAFYHLPFSPGGSLYNIPAFVYVYKTNNEYVGTWLKPVGSLEVNIGYATTITYVKGKYHSSALRDCSVLAANETYQWKFSTTYYVDPPHSTFSSFGSLTTGDCVCL